MDYVVTLGYFDWRKYKMWNQKTFVENLKWLRKMSQLTQEEALWLTLELAPELMSYV